MARIACLTFFAFGLWKWGHCGPALEEREIAMMKQFDTAKALGALADRNLQNWWGRYTEMMHRYRLDFDTKICNDRAGLNASLNAIEEQVQKVRFGWEQKKEQLDMLYEILHRDEYKNVTGLAEVLNQYLEAQMTTLNEEGEKLTSEETETTSERERFDNHPCPCIWGPWDEWSMCTVTCGGGLQNRSRAVERPSINQGAACPGDTTEVMSCNTNPCPIDCQWSQWGDWSECDKTCGWGERHKTRTHAILSQFGGKNCTGEATTSIDCNNLEDLRRTIAQQAAEIARLKQQLNCDVAKCTATVYKDCLDAEGCGTKCTSAGCTNCDYIPGGNGDSQCGWNPCNTITGTGDWQSVCTGGDALDVTGGCIAQIANSEADAPFDTTFQTGFTGLWKRYEEGAHLGDNFDRVKLTCPTLGGLL